MSKESKAVKLATFSVLVLGLLMAVSISGFAKNKYRNH